MTCVLYGECGKSSIFTPELPCTGNFEPQQLPDHAHGQLEKLCGPMPSLTCCSAGQVATLAQSIAKAEAIIGGCPACHKNFVELWCQFSCSPHQADFVEVLRTKQSLTGQEIPAEVNYSVAPEFGQGLYDSCKDVTFSATNGRAMDLIGGGAQNYSQFLKFIGDEKPMLGGSAFQINFPQTEPDSGAFNATTFGCSDPDYRCACIDCPSTCPQLAPLDPPQGCTMWGVNCMSLVLLTVYAAALMLLLAFYYNTRRQKPSTPLYAIVEDDEDPAIQDSLAPVRSTKSLLPYQPNTILQNCFERLGYFCAKFPLLVITICTLFVLMASVGLLGIELLDDPAELWVGPNSQEAREKSFYEDNFGMFYRTEQMFIVNKTGPVLQDYATVQWLFEVEDRVKSLQSNLTHDTLEDFCFMPLGPRGGCVVESITSYFGSASRLPESSWRQKLSRCLHSPVACLPRFQQPISPQVVLGPYDSDPLETNALVTTWLVNNHNDTAYLGRVEQWEYDLEQLLGQVALEAEDRGLHFSYSLESSLARELTKSSTTDIKIIALSYILMFVYASFSLGGRFRKRDALIHTKFSLGLGGIVIVLLSVISGIGICSSLGVKLTLIITEVIPFLVLALGVDNIYLLVHEFQLVNDLYPQYSVEERVSKAVGLIGPSIFLSSSCEIVAILIGTNVSMPAVHNFAIYSGVCVLINSALQLTMFVSAMTLDQYRIQARRADCFPCITLSEEVIDPDETQDLVFLESQEDTRYFSVFIRRLSPYILRRRSKLGILAFFVCWLAVSLSFIPKIEMGLDQRFAVPSSSFLVDYFTDISQYFEAGPPVYFVVSGANIEKREDQQKLCGRFGTCDQFSLVNIIEQERKRPDVSYLSVPAASWLDDFFQWLNPALDCCFEDKRTGRLCESESPHCQRCWQDRTWEPTMDGFPENNTFDLYAEMWLHAPTTTCPLAGKAPYGNAVSISDEDGVVASDFRSQHVALKSQADYINAYASARRIADDISQRTGFEVFPYSVFYVYFAQYHTLVGDTLWTMGYAVAVVFILSSTILGSVRTGGVVSTVVVIMICNICGLMYLFGVSLNALSLVNLLICVGIGVEFCIHIARAFTFMHKVNSLALQGVSKTERAFNALAGTGGTVFGGIAVTKLIGVSVLAFTKSKIFEVYYFRMWLALIFCATLHSLVLLPVMLSFAGGPAYSIADTGLIDQFRV